MNIPPAPQAILCIDLKKNRIRIHRQTLHLLGDPDYIQLLVNPSKMIIAIRRSFPNDHLAHRVSLRKLPDGICCELYSTDLMRALRKTNAEWEAGQSFRLYGDVNDQEGIAWFATKNTLTAGGCI